MTSILKSYPVAFDLSMMGTGKTFTSSYISKLPEFDFKSVVVICPVSIKSKWEFMKKTYGVPIHNIISFCSLRSVKDHQPEHGLLIRNDYTVKSSKSCKDDGTAADVNRVLFKTSDAYKQLVADGILLIIDEIQNIKNINAQFHSCSQLIKDILDDHKNKGKSRAILLSGSPIDQQEQVINFLRLIGIMKSSELSVYIPSTGRQDWRGFSEIIKFVTSIDDSVLSYIPPQGTGNTKDYIKTVYQMFQGPIKRTLVSSMTPITNQYQLHKKNGFYHIVDKTQADELSKHVQFLTNSCYFNEQTGSVEFQSGLSTLSNIQKALINIEWAKLPTFVRIVRQKLSVDPQLKIVVCVNYTKSIEFLQTQLIEFKPLILNGSVTDKNREISRLKFQRPDNEHRLLIGNLAVCSTGIDLDDQDGHWPRFCLVNPNYSTITLYQLTHRFYRMNTQSDATIHFMYGHHAYELPVLNALARKSAIMKETTSEQVDAGVIFPCDFQSFYEDAI
jgi:hypothetical protein